jgi:predicted alpha/beta hydrolase
LRQPLRYINGRPGDETYLAFRNIGGSGLFPQRHRLYLLFRHGKLAGWKGDWGHNWMWQ